MRYQGKIIKWQDDKGFGFVRATNDSKDVFLHISDIHRLNKRPEVNKQISYELIKDDRGRFRATHVAYLTKSANVNRIEQPPKLSSAFFSIHLDIFYISN